MLWFINLYDITYRANNKDPRVPRNTNTTLSLTQHSQNQDSTSVHPTQMTKVTIQLVNTASNILASIENPGNINATVSQRKHPNNTHLELLKFPRHLPHNGDDDGQLR